MRRILLLLLLISPCVHAEFCGYIDHSATSQRLEIPLYRSDTAQSMTGLTSASAGLTISVKSNASETATSYTSAGSTIETITAVGTYVAPTATMIRFKETTVAGVYALYGANALWAIAGSTQVVVGIRGVTSLLDKRCIFYQDAITEAELTANTTAALAAYGGGGVAQEDTQLGRGLPTAEMPTLAGQTAISDQVAALNDGIGDGTIEVQLNDASITAIFERQADGISFEDHLSFMSAVMYGCMNASGDVRTFQDPACTAARVAIDYSTGGRSDIVLTPP